jgi:predicted nuclease of predicted toxin-antitoxin system
MLIKLDENLPADLVAELAALGHDVDTAVSEGLAGHDDADVWAGAQTAGRMLVTQDLDFSDARRFAPGSHAGLVVVRLREPSRSRLVARILHVFRSEDVTSFPGCLVVVSERKVPTRSRLEQRPGLLCCDPTMIGSELAKLRSRIILLRARKDSNLRPTAPEAVALSS